MAQYFILRKLKSKKKPARAKIKRGKSRDSRGCSAQWEFTACRFGFGRAFMASAFGSIPLGLVSGASEIPVQAVADGLSDAALRDPKPYSGGGARSGRCTLPDGSDGVARMAQPDSVGAQRSVPRDVLITASPPVAPWRTSST